MRIPLGLLTGVPSWVYLCGAAAAVAMGALLWAHHQGASHQAARDAPVIAAAQTQAKVGDASAALATATLNDSAERQAHEVNIRATAAEAAQAVPKASSAVDADVDAAWRAGVERLRQPPGGAPEDGLRGVPGGPGAAAARGAPSPTR